MEVNCGPDEHQDNTAFDEKAPSFCPSAQLMVYVSDISSFKRDITFAPRVTGSAFLSMQTDIWPKVVGKTN
jgi:hypothetical protein